MIPKGLFAQIIMIIVSVAIVILHIKPQFTEIKAVQDDISLYQQEQEKVLSVYSTLADLDDQIKSIPATDLARLDTYLPDDVDNIFVMRDLFLITQAAGIEYVNTQAGGEVSGQGSSRRQQVDLDAPRTHTFTLLVQGSYEEIKTLLHLLGQNEYPLEVQQLSLSPIESEGEVVTSATDQLEANIVLATYSYRESDEGNQIVF